MQALRLNTPAATALTLLALAIGCAGTARAQIVLGEDWLMEPGFEIDLVTIPFTDADGNLARSGPNQSWFFGELVGATGEPTTLRAYEAATGAAADSFPTATMVIDVDGAGSGSLPPGESYLRREGDDLLLLGFGPDPDLPLLGAIRFADPLTFQSAPIAYGQRGSDVATVRFTVSADAFGPLLDSLDFPIAPDSIRVSSTQLVEYEVDGYGDISPEYDLGRSALRVRTETTVTQDVEALLPFVGWLSVAAFLPDSLGVPGGGGASAVTYSWLVEEYAYPVVQVSVDSLGAPLTATFRDMTFFVDAEEPGGEAIGDLLVRTQPGALGVTVVSEATGPAALRVLSASGALLHERVVDLGNAGEHEVSTAGWPAGVYVVQLARTGSAPAARRVLVGE